MAPEPCGLPSGVTGSCAILPELSSPWQAVYRYDRINLDLCLRKSALCRVVEDCSLFGAAASASFVLQEQTTEQASLVMWAMLQSVAPDQSSPAVFRPKSWVLLLVLDLVSRGRSPGGEGVNVSYASLDVVYQRYSGERP